MTAHKTKQKYSTRMHFVSNAKRLVNGLDETEMKTQQKKKKKKLT